MQTLSLAIAAAIFFGASLLCLHQAAEPLRTAWAQGVVAQASQR